MGDSGLPLGGLRPWRAPRASLLARDPARFSRAGLLTLALVLLGAALPDCGSANVPSPFYDAGADAADAAVDSDAAADAPDAAHDAPDADPELGAPCTEDAQCDDGVDCTSDRCDHDFGRCRATPDDAQCLDDVYCDGRERCDRLRGCEEGEAVACSDESTCTIDACDEGSETCTHSPRDGDGDGDPVWNCSGGHDCNDSEPSVSSLAREICANGRDDDCDGAEDETDCTLPAHDTCVDALVVDAPGTFSLSFAATASDYTGSCISTGQRDVVLAVRVPDGTTRDLDVTVRSSSTLVSLASQEPCGSAAGEVGCATWSSATGGGYVSRLLLRGASAGYHAIIVFAGDESEVSAEVAIEPPTVAPDNETCGTAAPLALGEHVQVSLVDAAVDVSSACNSPVGELVYSFVLGDDRDVNVSAVSLDGVGQPTVSLRAPACALPGDEITCRSSDPARVFARALPAGTYFVALGALAPTDVDLVVTASPPSSPAPDDLCSTAPVLVPGLETASDLSDHTDDIHLSCGSGAVDAAFALELGQRSDVLLALRMAQGDTGWVALSDVDCSAIVGGAPCAFSSRSPARFIAHDVAPGGYRAVIESQLGSQLALTPFTRPAVTPVLVPFADGCGDAATVPELGGYFQGNTANATSDWPSPCDLGGQSAPDQMLRLHLATTRRVIFDMKGSAYNTLLVIRQADGCPGTPVLDGCAAGYVSDRSYLDLVLDAGDYHVQVDGYAAQYGEWMLDVFTADP